MGQTLLENRQLRERPDEGFAASASLPHGAKGQLKTDRIDLVRRRRRPPRSLADRRFLSGLSVAQLRYTDFMKTATIPSVRVEPEFRAEVEAVLTEDETLSEFVEAAVRDSVARRRVQAEFIARGLRSRDEARRTGEYVDAEVVLEQLQRKLDTARARVAKTRK